MVIWNRSQNAVKLSSRFPKHRYAAPSNVGIGLKRRRPWKLWNPIGLKQYTSPIWAVSWWSGNTVHAPNLPRRKNRGWHSTKKTAQTFIKISASAACTVLKSRRTVGSAELFKTAGADSPSDRCFFRKGVCQEQASTVLSTDFWPFSLATETVWRPLASSRRLRVQCPRLKEGKEAGHTVWATPNGVRIHNSCHGFSS